MKASVFIGTSLDGFIARANGALDFLPLAARGESLASHRDGRCIARRMQPDFHHGLLAVERVLVETSMRDSTIQIVVASPESGDAVRLIRALDDDLRDRYPGIPLHGLRPEDLRDHRLAFLVAHADGEAIGCGAVRELEPGVGEIKRMFVQPAWRRRGVARQLLAALEAQARKLGYAALRLETALGQPEAIGLYRSAGYVDIPPFGEYIGNPASVCFEKRLT